MLNVCMLLWLVSLKLGAQEGDPVKLDLASVSTEIFSKTRMEFDNVSYIVYKTLDGADIEEVAEGDLVVWSESNIRRKAKAIIEAYDNDNPFLLYVYTPLYTYHDYYFARADGKWVRISYEWYSYKLESIKAKIMQEFKMDLDYKYVSNKVIHYPSTPSKGYDTYIPLKGNALKSVCYGGTKIWAAKSNHERAVAVWTHSLHDSHYLIRILVFDGHSINTFLDFVRLRKHWVRMDNTPLTMKPSHKYPDDILFPEYLILKAEKQASSGETNTSTEFKDLATRLAISYDYEYHNRPIPSPKCRKLILSRSPQYLPGMYQSSVIHKVLKIISIYPYPGQYFGIITYFDDQIYERNIDVEACIAVHIYVKDSVYYLADVVVTNPKKPRSEYHVKLDGKWHPVSDNKFFTLLDELIIHERSKSQT